MTAKLQDVADVLAETEFDEASARKLVAMMNEYRTTYHRSFRSLLRVPGFARLWDAIDQAARFATRGDEEAPE